MGFFCHRQVSGLRAETSKFTNLKNNTSTDTSGYITTINNSNLCGYSDWRLPTADELLELANYGSNLDINWFPNTQGSNYWSSGHYISATGSTGMQVFMIGQINTLNRASSANVRLVRGGVNIFPMVRYTISANGQEVTDNKTGLIWRRCVESMSWNDSTCTGPAVIVTYSYEQSLSKAKSQSLFTGAAWRIPNVKELNSIVDSDYQTFLAIDKITFPATPYIWYFLTSTSTINGLNSHVVHFMYGRVLSNANQGGGYVRLVR